MDAWGIDCTSDSEDMTFANQFKARLIRACGVKAWVEKYPCICRHFSFALALPILQGWQHSLDVLNVQLDVQRQKASLVLQKKPKNGTPASSSTCSMSLVCTLTSTAFIVHPDNLNPAARRNAPKSSTAMTMVLYLVVTVNWIHEVS